MKIALITGITGQDGATFFYRKTDLAYRMKLTFAGKKVGITHAAVDKSRPLSIAFKLNSFKQTLLYYQVCFPGKNKVSLRPFKSRMKVPHNLWRKIA